MTKPFRGCRYEVHVFAPSLTQKKTSLTQKKTRWSRHHSIVEARKSYREAVNNHRGDHPNGAFVELHDVVGSTVVEVLTREGVRSWP